MLLNVDNVTAGFVLHFFSYVLLLTLMDTSVVHLVSVLPLGDVMPAGRITYTRREMYALRSSSVGCTVDIGLMKDLDTLRYRGSRAGKSVRNRRRRKRLQAMNSSYTTRGSTCMSDYEGQYTIPTVTNGRKSFKYRKPPKPRQRQVIKINPSDKMFQSIHVSATHSNSPADEIFRHLHFSSLMLLFCPNLTQ